jgi:hypothetical protein
MNNRPMGMYPCLGLISGVCRKIREACLSNNEYIKMAKYRAYMCLPK